MPLHECEFGAWLNFLLYCSDAFSEDDWKVVQLVLTLVRNLLDIQDLPTQTALVVESSKVLSIRDELLEHLFQENIMDLLVALAHHVAGSHGHLCQDNLLFLEIFHHIFWGQSPEKIAGANSKVMQHWYLLHHCFCCRPLESSGRLLLIFKYYSEKAAITGRAFKVNIKTTTHDDGRGKGAA